MPRWGARSGVIPGAFGIDRRTFDDIDRIVRDLDQNLKAFHQGENLLIHLLAKTQQGVAQAKSRGMVDPSGQAGKAWGIPVRRISEDYYKGWKIKKIAHGIWMTYNDSREAFFIEFAINPRATGAVRRPILKMSAVATLRFIQRTRLVERFTASTIGATRNQKGQYRSFGARMSGSQLLGVVGPEGRLPG